MPSTLIIGGVELRESDGQIPPAPDDVPPAVRSTLLEALDTAPEVMLYTGTSVTRPIRFASGQGMGWVDTAQKTALMNLYLSRQKFSVQTDLLGVRGVVRTYQGCFFEAGIVPLFGAHEVMDGDHHHLDLVIRMPML